MCSDTKFLTLSSSLPLIDKKSGVYLLGFLFGVTVGVHQDLR